MNPASNNGTLTFTSGFSGASALLGTSVDLFDQAGNHGYSFKFNNVDDHRLGGHAGYGGPETFVGWGWMDHHVSGVHVYDSDWLFTAVKVPSDTPDVPAPATMLSFAAGLGLLRFMRRRKRIA
jgi:hypothetical protein